MFWYTARNCTAARTKSGWRWSPFISTIQGLFAKPVAYENGKFIRNDGRSNCVGLSHGETALLSRPGRCAPGRTANPREASTITTPVLFSTDVGIGLNRAAVAVTAFACPFPLPFPLALWCPFPFPLPFPKILPLFLLLSVFIFIGGF